ncbi:MAG: carboxypeptidase-like regulatory domain-containing protein [Acidobacteria bacterium]|nr:carboxypeptidase-like regulatory domain-containing protein [Acidobacteriota bacterium]
MVSSTRQAIAGILVIFGVALFARAQTQTAPVKEPSSTVSGRITIKDKPVPGIAVGLSLNDSTRQQPVTHRAVTDVNGEYRITKVPAGNYYMAVSAPGFVLPDATGIQRSLIIGKGEAIEHVDFALTRGGVVTGKVFDADGRPLIEQEVALFSEGAGDRGRSRYPYLNGNTDDRGVYRIFGIPTGKYKVAAGSGDDDSFGARYRPASYRRTYHPNVADQARATVIEVREGSEATNIDIVLGRTVTTYTASGRIVDEAGQPVANVPYAITHFASSSSTHSMSTGAVSNARGEFKFDKLTPGQYAAMIRSEENSEMRADHVPFEITDSDVTGLVLITKKASSVSGVVILEGNEDKVIRDQLIKTGMGVSVAGSGSQRGGWGHSTRPAPDGSFRIGGLAAGTATFYISSSSRFRILRVERDGVIQPRGIEIKERENVTGIRIIAAYANASIRGTIEVQNGTLPPNAQFSVWIQKLGEEPGTIASASSASIQVDARGQFVVDGLMPGTYELHAGVYIPGTRGSTPTKKQEVAVAAGVTNVTFTLDLSSLPKRP